MTAGVGEAFARAAGMDVGVDQERTRTVPLILRDRGIDALVVADLLEEGSRHRKPVSRETVAEQGVEQEDGFVFAVGCRLVEFSLRPGCLYLMQLGQFRFGLFGRVRGR